jgi:4-alpha-glucanotransferase
MAKKQWFDLKKYANSKGVSIMGDMPLYVALDSVDVWVNPKLYKLDENFVPTKVAGVPPDYFSKDGQLWGNPVYNYAEHTKEGFSWWTDRIKGALKVFDLVRIDHFRGLDRYYEVDSDKTDAKIGEWIDVPSHELFNAVHSAIDKDKIIAEDLGIIDDGVRELLKWTGYPGMKILSFAFNGDNNNPYLPQNIPENAVCFTGTHDNDTLLGLIKSFNMEEKRAFKSRVKESLILMGLSTKISCDKELLNAIINLGYKSKAKLFIIPMQDVLGLNSSYRINVPGEVRNQKWAVRLSKKHFTENSIKYIKTLTKKYKR